MIHIYDSQMWNRSSAVFIQRAWPTKKIHTATSVFQKSVLGRSSQLLTKIKLAQQSFDCIGNQYM